jgi:hypothetical protein
MVQGYYTLDEAAQVLGVSTEELKQKARTKELRSFQDRGTLHFRIQDIQELARQRQMTSDPDLTLGEASLPPASGPATPRINTGAQAPDIFNFDVGSEEDADAGLFGGPGSGQKSGGKGSGARTPKKQAEGSDSDVRLAPEGDDLGFTVAGDSSVKLPGKDSGSKPPSTVRPPSKPGLPAVGSSSRPSKLGGPASGVRSSKPGAQASRPSKLGSPATPSKSPRPGSAPQPADSGVRLVPMDSDSDVRIVGTTNDEIDLGALPPASMADSNVRLDRPVTPSSPPEAMMLTEEINLDEELKKQEDAQRRQTKSTRVKPKSELRMPPSSPFELSEADLDAPSAPGDAPTISDSSDYELVPGPDGAASPDSSSDFSLEVPEETSVLTEGSGEGSLTGPTSGISINNPLDEGISLEEPHASDDQIDFDLSLEVDATPRPEAQPSETTDSEFELNLDASGEGDAQETTTSEFELLSLDSAEAPAEADSGSSEFELSLDTGDSAAGTESDSEFELSLDTGEVAGGEPESDSEFELTLDDAGASDEETPQVKVGEAGESDFEVPDLGASGEGSADAEIESSDFDLALDESEVVAEDESGSQVVALDEEEAVETLEGDEEGAAVAEGEEEGGEFADLEGEEEAEAEEEEAEAGAVREVVRTQYLKPAPWGALPVVFMLPCVIVMVLVGLMGFELVQSASGYKAPGVLTKAIGELIGQKIK